MQHSELTYYKDIQTRKVNWLWYPYIPFGKITIIQGDPGEGKTTFVLSLLSVLSNGDKLPCSDINVSGKAIYQNLEDDNADTIKPRLEKHGANCANICFIDKRDGRLSIEGNDLKWAVIESKAKILVLDPIQAFIGENIDINRANAVRPLMNKLKELAESTGCAVLLVGHLNKNSGGKVNYLILSCNEFCCPEYAVRFYNALKEHDIPVEILNGKRIAQYLSGEGRIGIVPCFENPTDYFYGGFRDESVGEFINLPNKDDNKLVEATQWEPITIAKPKSRQV